MKMIPFLAELKHLCEQTETEPRWRDDEFDPGDVPVTAATWQIDFFHQPTVITNEEGAYTSLHCAISQDCVEENGLYYDACKVKTPSKPSRDEALARELWDRSAEWTGAEWSI